jgi:ketoreductase RED2
VGASLSERLDGQVVVVTGSTVGIGEGIARSFAREGASVVVNSVSSVETGEQLAARLPAAMYVQADVSDETQCKRLVNATLERFGRLDVLINNAGVGPLVPHPDLEGVTDDMWRRTFDVNLLGPWYMTRAAVPALRRDGGGCVLNITSLAASRDTYYSAIPYALSKAALNHLTFLLANVLGPEIRVNAVAPGLIASRQSMGADVWDAIVERTQRDTPIGRVGTPGDVGDACVLLALSSYVTGQVVLCDGGKHLRAGSPPTSNPGPSQEVDHT